MTDYEALRIEATPCSTDITDLMADLLAEIGYESFVADDKGLTAYIAADRFSLSEAEVQLEALPIPCSMTFTNERIPGRNWNREWELNYFKPIVVEGRCVVHSSFHTDVPEAEYDIVVDPKMAFGTGHHSTTRLMLGYMLDADLRGKSVIDMGTGTGILAILCKMRGADRATGIEIDPGAWENAVENTRLNGVEAEMICGDASALAALAPADIFLANINRNIITADIDKYAPAILPGGEAFFSGFYTEDIPIIERAANAHGLRLLESREDQNWAALRFRRE